MGFREKMRKMARMALLLFILAAAAFLSAITAIRLAIQGREVTMPQVTGLKAGDAQSTLAALGLGMRIADHVYSDQPADFVVRQSPQPGTHVKVPQRAHVVLSLGPRQIAIPALEGKSLRASRIELLRAGLQTGSIAEAHLGAYEAGQVVQQSPRPGEATAGSPRVSLLVSKGEREAAWVMPDLAGLSLPEAQRRLALARLRLGSIRFVPAGDAPGGTVVAQTPPRGARISAGTAAELQVAELVPRIPDSQAAPENVLKSPPGN
jgi:beta-lactam-binding protein with PASTA domain